MLWLQTPRFESSPGQFLIGALNNYYIKLFPATTTTKLVITFVVNYMNKTVSTATTSKLLNTATTAKLLIVTT